jgi:hypothetical protein
VLGAVGARSVSSSGGKPKTSRTWATARSITSACCVSIARSLPANKQNVR